MFEYKEVHDCGYIVCEAFPITLEAIIKKLKKLTEKSVLFLIFYLVHPHSSACVLKRDKAKLQRLFNSKKISIAHAINPNNLAFRREDSMYRIMFLSFGSAISFQNPKEIESITSAGLPGGDLSIIQKNPEAYFEKCDYTAILSILESIPLTRSVEENAEKLQHLCTTLSALSMCLAHTCHR
jgi:hypothetical protein